MAFWSGARLRDELKANPSIIADWAEGHIDCNSYTLHMGEEYYVTPEFGSKSPRRKRALREPKVIGKGSDTRLARGETLIIPPGQFAFLLTEEEIRMPTTAMGFISLKSHFKFRGLINVSGFHVDPGFCGNLIYSVFNAGPSEIHIARGDALFLLWIADLSPEFEKKFVRDTATQVEIPSRLISDVSREVQSFQRMSQRIELLEGRTNIIWYTAISLVAALGLLIALLALIPDELWARLAVWLSSGPPL